MLLAEISSILSKQDLLPPVKTNKQPKLVAVKIDRYRTEEMWYNIIMEIAGKNPFNRKIAGTIYSLIQKRMEEMTDEEIEDQINRLVGMIDYVSIDIKGMLRK